jgi:hypothetical protein
MNQLLLSPLLTTTALGLSCCCCLFSNNNKLYETKETKLVGHRTVTKEVQVSGKGSKACMLTKTVTVETPSYKEAVMKMATDQGCTVSPHIALVPSMRPLVP